MNRLVDRISLRQQQQKKLLATYMVAGVPNIEMTVEIMHHLVDSGADIIELGVPFSDPNAEGVIIQQAHEKALENGVGLEHIFDVIKQFRKQDQHTPIILMGYANPIMRMGYPIFAERAKSAGVDGVLTVDLPAEESIECNQYLSAKGISNIFLIAPTTTQQRIPHICHVATGFIYYVTLKGITGSDGLNIDDVAEKIKHIRSHTSLPILAGFGIKDARSAQLVNQHADGVVVGSAIVSIIATINNPITSNMSSNIANSHSGDSVNNDTQQTSKQKAFAQIKQLLNSLVDH